VQFARPLPEGTRPHESTPRLQSQHFLNHAAKRAFSLCISLRDVQDKEAASASQPSISPGFPRPAHIQYKEVVE
jgi:hypothetical protein